MVHSDLTANFLDFSTLRNVHAHCIWQNSIYAFQTKRVYTSERVVHILAQECLQGLDYQRHLHTGCALPLSHPRHVRRPVNPEHWSHVCPREPRSFTSRRLRGSGGETSLRKMDTAGHPTRVEIAVRALCGLRMTHIAHSPRRLSRPAYVRQEQESARLTSVERVER